MIKKLISRLKIWYWKRQVYIYTIQSIQYEANAKISKIQGEASAKVLSKTIIQYPAWLLE